MSALEFVSSTFSSPTYLFLFLNLIIATIFITSCLGSHRPHMPQPAPLARAPSSLIDRVKSINLSLYKFESHHEPEPAQVLLARTPSLLNRLRSVNFNQHKFEHMNPEPEPEPERLHQVDPLAPLSRAPSSLLERVRSIKFPSFYDLGEPEQDSEPEHDDASHLAKERGHGAVRRIRSESERMGEQEEGKPRMRKTASEKSAAAMAAEDDAEVEEINAKADDFIQRFRHQLRLQRLDSIMRYKDLLARGH